MTTNMCVFVVIVLTANANSSVEAKTLQLPGLPGVACFCSSQCALIPHELCQPSFF